MSDWYYAKDNQQMGPKNESEVKASIATGEIPADTLVWKDGMNGWMPANQVPAFSFRPPPAPAKIQPTAPAAAPVVTTTASPAAAAVLTPTATQTTTTTTTATPAKPIDVSAQVQNALASVNTGVGISGDPADVAKNKNLSFFSYFGILFLIPLLAAGTSPFAKYHANQGLLLCLASLVVYIPMTIVFIVLSLVLPYTLANLIEWPIRLVVLVVEVIAIYLGVMNVKSGVMKPLPFIGNLFVFFK